MVERDGNLSNAKLRRSTYTYFEYVYLCIFLSVFDHISSCTPFYANTPRGSTPEGHPVTAVEAWARFVQCVARGKRSILFSVGVDKNMSRVSYLRRCFIFFVFLMLVFVTTYLVSVIRTAWISTTLRSVFIHGWAGCVRCALWRACVRGVQCNTVFSEKKKHYSPPVPIAWV